ncbi:putative transcriptional regulator, partial [Kineosphaera limosa NBRC 100340]
PQPPPAPARGLRGPVVPAEHCAVEVARLLPLLATLSPGQWQALDPPGPPGAAATLVSSALRAVQDYPRTDLLATLAAYLRHRGRHEECAGELGIHRNTLRHRLRLLRTLLHDTVDTDLDDPDLSAHLWLGLRERGLA